MAEDLSKYVLCLQSLHDQGLGERVDAVIPDLIRNVLDPNTDATKARKITIVIEVKPDAERRNLMVGFDVSTTFQKLKKYFMPGFLTMDPASRQHVIVAFDPQQGDMFRGAQPGAEHGRQGAVVNFPSR